MISYNALAEARRHHIQNVVAPLAVPLFRLLEDAVPEFLCSGLLLGLADSTVLLTAGHAVVDKRPALQLASGRIAELDNPVRMGRDSLSHADPLSDVASVLLTLEESAAISGTSVIPASACAPFEYRSPNPAYIVYGLRDNRQRLDHDAAMFYHQCTSIMVGPSEAPLPPRSPLRPELSLVLGTTPANFRSEKGKGGVPKFFGMSGSPIWRYNPNEEYSYQSLPPLVAMLVGRPSHTPKAIFGVRIGVLLEHVASAYPDLTDRLPRFA